MGGGGGGAYKRDFTVVLVNDAIMKISYSVNSHVLQFVYFV